MNFHGLEKKEVDEATAGDIVAVSGLGELKFLILYVNLVNLKF